MTRPPLTILLWGTLALVSTACRSADLPYADALQLALERALHDGQGEYSLGISAAVIVPGFKPWVGVAGQSHAGVPMTPDMLFNVGSVAKSLEAALALKFSERGMLDLDAPVSTWLPAHDHVDGRITVRQLLNHTSGLFNVFEHPDFPWVGPHIDYGRTWQLDEVLDSFVEEPYGPPGYAQHYSSTNYLLLTAILEQIAGVPVPDEVTRLLLEPQGLKHSFMSMGSLPPSPFIVADPWADVDSDGDLDNLRGEPQTWIATLTHPVLYMTPTDMARWTRRLHYEHRVLSSQSLQQMYTRPERAVPDPEGGKYGLGVADFDDRLGLHAIGHAGSSLGYSATALYLPDRAISLAWAINTGESPRELAEQLMHRTWSELSRVLQANSR